MLRSAKTKLLVPLAMLLPSSPALAACSIERYAELPITMVGLRPTLTAAINGSEQTFLADSGAFFSVISPGTAQDLGLKLTPPPGNLRMIGVGGDAEIKVATVKAFSIVGATIANLQFIVGGSEPGTAGVIGQNLLGQRDVEYDLPHGAIRLFQTKACQKTNLAYWIRPGEAVSVMDLADWAASGFHTVGSVTINNRSVRAIFDTGAGATIMSLAAAARAGLKPDMPGATPGGMEHGFGRKAVRTWIVPVKTLKIGDEQIERARLRIGDIGTGVDMLIGADFFISHRVFVSNAVHKMFFSYTGGPIFDIRARLAGGATAAAAATELGPPLDAAALSRRGAVEAAQHDDAGALADVSQAIALAPAEPRYLLQRASLLIEKAETALAFADVDAAIKLKGDAVDARLMRAKLDLIEHRTDKAIEDLDAASAAAGNAADQRLAIAQMYWQADALDRSIAQSTLWIANHPADARRAQALNARCWARALSGKELGLALDDCNAALRLNPRTASFLDSRGLVRLRMGDHATAIADYDAALAINPGIGWSLYGRSAAERAEGKADAAKADRDAALAINPELPALARRYGIGD